MNRHSKAAEAVAATGPRPVVVLGVCGSIAAHKAVDLTSQLTKAGFEVHVVLTASAQKFVTAIPFRTLSRQPVLTDLWVEEDWKPGHIKLADVADLLLVAPATANLIAKMALGLADDALSCVALALNPKARVMVAPAMNGHMWTHPATRHNVELLEGRGVEFVGPGTGLLSCGYEGQGRLAPVETILARAQHLLSRETPRPPAK